MNRFADRVVIITGASRGIGLAIAARVVAEGGQVCITARSSEPLAEAVRSLGGSDRAIGVVGRADDHEHQYEAVASTLSAFGRLDVLVNNTGINSAYGTLLDLDQSAARKIMDVNVLAALSWVAHAHRAGLGQALPDDIPGAVVNVASIAGLHPAPGIAYYGVSKAALIGLTIQLASELAPAIRVNAVAPAVVKTRFASALYEGKETEVSSGYALGRLGSPQDVAAAVAFLASDDASWITGQTLVLDGGVTLKSAL
jgi:NAD(P)-dependent dehydrogenase (short-subunit alcohol dehydrogenase family)